MRLCIILIVAALAGHGFAADWCQWRGPDFNGTSPETGLPDALGAEQEKWVTELPGPGEATPVVCNGVVYLSGYDEENRILFAMQVDAADGAVRWTKTVTSFEELPRRNIIASPSPVADETGVIFMFSTGILVRYSLKGEEIWRKDLTEEYGPFSTGWSYSASPLLFRGTLYVSVLRDNRLPKDSTYTGSMESYLLGLDPVSGAERFRVVRATEAEKDFRDSYATPIPVQVGGMAQILVYGGDCITGHDPGSGKELWRSGYMDLKMDWGRAASTPVADGHTIYCGFPLGKKLFARDMEKMARGEEGTEWVYDEASCDVPSPTLWKGYLYILEESRKRLICLDAKTGALQWKGQLERGDTFYTSITAADDKLFVVNRKGFVSVVAADPSVFRILSTRAFDEKPTDSTISVSDGKLFLRTAKHLYCFGK